jgi:DNA-binding protein H-NS
MDISNLSLAELKDLLNQIPVEIKRREKAEKANLLKDLEKLAADRGFSLSDVMGETSEKKPKTTVAAKYRSPADESVTWTGRGRQPKWVQEHLANGGTLESITI